MSILRACDPTNPTARRSRVSARSMTVGAVGLLIGAAAAVVPAGPAHAATWSTVTTPNASQFGNSLTGVDARTTTDVWAVGNARHGTHPDSRPLAARWNGSTWTIVSTPALVDYGAFTDVDANSASNAWAVGAQEMFVNPQLFTSVALIERWNGTSWTRLAQTLPPGASSSNLAAVKVFGDADAWAAGHYFHSTAPNNKTLIQRWNGSTWTQVASPNPNSSFNSLTGLDGVSTNDLWAVGTAGVGAQAGALVLRWNGSAWSSVSLPAPGTGLSEVRLADVVAVSANDVWIVGEAWHSGLFNRVPYYLHWTGSGWQSGYAANVGGIFTAVTALSATQVYATTGSGIARWNGSTWAAESASVPGPLYDISAPGSGNVWAVGSQFDQTLFANRTLALRTTNG